MAPQTTNSYLQSSEDEAVYAAYLAEHKMVAPQPKIEEIPQPMQAIPAPQQPDKLATMELEMARQKRENEELKYNLELWKSQLQRQNVPVPPIEQINRDDPMTRGVYEDDMTLKMRELQQKISDLEFQVSKNGVESKYQDYDEVVEKYTVPLVRDKPHLAEGIRNASNKPLFAYELGRMQRDQEQLRTQLEQAKSQYSYQQASPHSPATTSPQLRMLENAMKPGSLSMTGGQGTFVPQEKPNFATMSDADFDAFYKANTRDH